MQSDLKSFILSHTLKDLYNTSDYSAVFLFVTLKRLVFFYMKMQFEEEFTWPRNGHLGLVSLAV
ncbi:hypothetical protein C5167_029788 [Papaver somniferum]|nr:hypothetical protein C5167_029788 [Papaver somniferum]